MGFWPFSAQNRRMAWTKGWSGIAASLLFLIVSAPSCGSGTLVLDGGHGGTTGGAGGAPLKACARERDCPSGMVCGYAIDGGCNAHGVCVPRWPPPGEAACGALLDLCGCDGRGVTAGCNYATGYAPAPTQSDYAQCADAGPPGGGDAGQCQGWGATCGAGGTCCDGLGCSPSGSTALPGSCVPL